MRILKCFRHKFAHDARVGSIELICNNKYFNILLFILQHAKRILELNPVYGIFSIEQKKVVCGGDIFKLNETA